ncbi:MAG: GntR family transcriptional regulator [Gemmiger sp.]|nr:GntR family transcriptional regulator [Gemmiger sp.]
MLKYQALAEQLRTGIAEGRYPAGEKLPSENELVARCGLSRQTVRQALALLEQEGRIQRRQGSGSVVLGAAARRLPTHYVAIITTYIGEYIFPELLRGMEEVLTQNGYIPTLSATHNRVDNERAILTNLLGHPLDGVIVEGTKTALPNPNAELYRRLERLGVPIVFINGYYPEYKPPLYVVADDRGGGRQAAEYLLQKGHTKIAGIFKSDDIQGHRRYAGYLEALGAAGIGMADDSVLWYTTETCDALLKSDLDRVLAGNTAVICYNDEIAVKVQRALAAKGRLIPTEMAVVGFDNSTFGDMVTPRITSFVQDKATEGRLAAEKLLGLIQGTAQKSAVLPWQLVEKEST